jgi:hypothetical protein
MRGVRDKRRARSAAPQIRAAFENKTTRLGGIPAGSLEVWEVVKKSEIVSE